MQLPHTAILMELVLLPFSPFKSKWNRSVPFFTFFLLLILPATPKVVKVCTIDFSYYVWLPRLLKLRMCVAAEFFECLRIPVR
jgi:hypothetical protein